jgi:signal transduction histidine kinase/ActR/RegA family two-component response regulator
MSSRRFRRLAWIATIALAYFIAAKLGLSMAFVAEQVTVVWPPTGIALSALILLGNWIWPGIWLGAFAANATANEPIGVALGIASGNTLEALAGVWLLRRVGFDEALVRLRDVLALILVAAVVSTTISATIGGLSLVLGGLQPWTSFRSLWTHWWLGDAIGALLVAPAILTWACRRSSISLSRRRAEAAILIAGVMVIGQIIFSDRFETTAPVHQLAYLVFPFLVWAALRFGQRGTATVILLASAMTIWGTVRGLGPFSGPSVSISLIQLQIFMAVVAVTALMLAAALAEHRTAELRRSADHATVQALSESATLEQAAPRIVRALGENLDGDLTVLWMAAPGTTQIRSVAAWRRPGSPIELVDGLGSEEQGTRLTQRARRRRIEADGGFAGRIAASRKSGWSPDILTEERKPPGAVPVVAFAAPIVLGQEVIGTVELRSQDICHPDEDLLDVLTMVANKISQFVERREVQAERERLLVREQAVRTEAEELVVRLQQIEAELRRGDRAKTEFLAVLSHELRNPLAPLSHALELIRHKVGSDPDTKPLIEILDRQLGHLVRLVDDLLDLSRIANGRIELRKELVDLSELMANVVEALRPVIEDRRHELVFLIPPQPLWIQADPMRIEQVFANLLNNAAKFTEPGGKIWFEAGSEDNEAVVKIRDNGIGIPPEMLGIIFDLFAQADRTVLRPHGQLGLGIGLSLVRSLVENHGGTVTAASGGPRQGSEFTVRFPLAAAEPIQKTGPMHRPAAAWGKPQRVLVVDDNRDAAESLSLVLQGAGHRVELAHDGVSALKAAKSLRPETVFLDIHLAGGMDGYEVARRLRTEKGLENIFIVALTGFGLDEDRRRSEEAGIDHHVVKPVEPERLRELLIARSERT